MLYSEKLKRVGENNDFYNMLVLIFEKKIIILRRVFILFVEMEKNQQHNDSRF